MAGKRKLFVLVAVVAMLAGLLLLPAGAQAQGDLDEWALADQLMAMNDKEVRQLPPCLGIPPTIIGTPGDDVIWGTPGDDVIFGRAGDDLIFGMEGNDVICGGAGNDTIWGQGGFLNLIAGANGDDRLHGGGGFDGIWGGLGNDLLTGRGGDDFLHAGDGPFPGDTNNGGAGFDVCVSGDTANKNCEIVAN